MRWSSITTRPWNVRVSGLRKSWVTKGGSGENWKNRPLMPSWSFTKDCSEWVTLVTFSRKDNSM